MFVMLIFACSLSALPMSSPAAPATATLSLPGNLFASAMSSLTDFAGTDGWMTSASGIEASSLIGAKSCTGS
jgi:hypothetical protein